MLTVDFYLLSKPVSPFGAVLKGIFSVESLFENAHILQHAPLFKNTSALNLLL